MTAGPSVEDAAPAPLRARHAAMAVAVLFFVNGATFSNWLPRIPEIRDRLGLGNAGLGATLLGGGAGGVIGAILVGRAMDRVGSRRLLVLAATALAAGLPLIALVPEPVLLLAVLTALGTLDVCNDVAMNAQGVMVQQRIGRSIMNRLHAMWSLGFTAGALVGSAASAAGIGVRLHLAVVGAALLATALGVRRWLIPVDPPHEHLAPGAAESASTAARPSRRRRRPAGIAMTAAAFAAAALEVTPNEWAAVFMRDVFDAGRLAGFGTVACASAMLLARLAGDHVLDRIGERRLLLGAIGVCAVGGALTVTAPVPAIAIAGFAVWGAGLSVVFPQLYATAARLPGMSAGAGLGSMLLGQRFGGMVTAVAVGGVSGWLDPRAAFAIVGGAAVAVLAATVPPMLRSAVRS